MTATRPPLRTISTHWPTGSAAPRALERDVGALAGQLTHGRDRVAGREVDGVVPQLGGLGQPRAATHHDHTRGAERQRALGDDQAHHAGPDDGDRVARALAAADHGVKRDRRRVEHRRLLVGELVRHGEDALDRVHDVLRVGAIGVVAVLRVQPLDAEVLADVVPALDAAAAVATGGVRRARDARAVAEAQGGGTASRLDDLPAPLVPGDQRPVLGPEAGVVALNDVRVGAADRDRADPAQDLEVPRAGPRHLLDREPVRRPDDERLAFSDHR